MINDKEQFDFNEVPSSWAVCAGTDCPKAAACLRHLAYCHIPHEKATATCVMPWAQTGRECRFFAPAEKVLFARGFEQLIRRLHSRDARHDLRIALSDYLGSKGTYDRYKKGMRWLTPEQQQWIITFLRPYGFEEEMPFDEYRESYAFPATPST